MSDECELELEYCDDNQEVIDDIEGLVETDFAAHEEICGEEDDNIVIQEEVVINNDNNSSIGNDFEEEDIEFEEENEANDGDDEELNETSDGNDVLSADDQNSALMAEESINADNDSNNDLVIDQINPEDNNPETESMNLKQQELESQKQSSSGQSIIATNGETEQNIDIKKIKVEPEMEANGKQIIIPLNAKKSISSSAPTKPVKTENEENKTINTDIIVKSEPEVAANGGEQASGAPSSMYCPGSGMSPNLMCTRCYYLYHVDSVPEGVLVCPNCLNGETNGVDPEVAANGGEQAIPNGAQSLSVSATPTLPEPPQLQQRVTRRQRVQQITILSTIGHRVRQESARLKK